METCLRRHHFAAIVLLLLVTDSQMAPLHPIKAGAKTGDGDQTAEESVPEAAKSETALGSDQAPAASDHGHLGRVQIKVYRGPGDHHHHAPYGYWVKQPADDPPHHH